MLKSFFHRVRSFPFAPILFGLYPVVALYANNSGEVSIDVLPRPLLVVLIMVLILLLMARLALRDWNRAALLVSLMVLLFFSYGHFYDLKKTVLLPLTDFMRHRFLLPLFLTAFVIGAFFILRSHENSRLMPAFNLISIVLLAMPLGQIGVHAITTSHDQQQAAQGELPVRTLSAPTGKPLPSVYFILLDSYMRSDALLRDMDYDNSAFVQRLEDLGFYVPSCSRSNYGFTQGTMTTALNMDDLASLNDEIKQNDLDMGIFALIKHSKVRQQLESLGYTTVAFDSGYEWSRIHDADIYLGLNRDTFAMQSFNGFEAMLIKSTMLRVYTDDAIRQNQAGLAQANSPFNEHIELERFILTRLPDLATDTTPKFVFAHVLIPHWPYVFLPDGSIRNDPNFDQYSLTKEQLRQGYVDSIAYVSDRIAEDVEKILADSKTPPVIVIFGDHGLAGENRLQNFTAIYLPGNSGDLYDTITPVNFFRVIFNRLFDAGYEHVPDVSYDDVDPSEKENLQLMPETAPGCLK